MPAYLTLFLTVLSANVIALFPYTYSITSQLIVTFTISLFAFATKMNLPSSNVVVISGDGAFLSGGMSIEVSLPGKTHNNSAR